MNQGTEVTNLIACDEANRPPIFVVIRAKAFELLETCIDLDMKSAAYLQFGGMLAKAWHHLAEQFIDENKQPFGEVNLRR